MSEPYGEPEPGWNLAHHIELIQRRWPVMRDSTSAYYKAWRDGPEGYEALRDTYAKKDARQAKRRADRP